MPQETVGFVELEWTCSHCGVKNEGTRQLCKSCGAPMPESAKFEQSGKGDLITDKDKLARAEKGPDMNCPYCGTRNQADATKCVHCSGDLTDATKRAAGEVIGAFQSSPQPDSPCPSCGTPNAAGASRCSKCGSPLGAKVPPKPVAVPQPKSKGIGIIAIAVIGMIIVACIALAVLASKTSDSAGIVKSMSWQRTIDIEQLQSVTHQDWKDRIPSDAKVGTCTQKVRSTQEAPGTNTVKVCGTAYTKDQGNGVGKVVKDCYYEVMADSCNYTVMEWKSVDAVVAKGSDLNPTWPSVSTNTTQRAGARNEDYKVTFVAGDKTYSYSPETQQEYNRFTIGSKWTLTINGLNIVTKVAPAS